MENKSARAKVQAFGGFLTAMVIPNIGAFIAWGFITALFIPTGWLPKEVAIKWSAAPDMTPQTVLYRRPVAQFSNFQPKIVSSWLILALFQANFLISGRSRLCPYQLVNSNQVRQGE